MFFLIKFTKHKETYKLPNIHDKKIQKKQNCEEMP